MVSKSGSYSRGNTPWPKAVIAFCSVHGLFFSFLCDKSRQPRRQYHSLLMQTPGQPSLGRINLVTACTYLSTPTTTLVPMLTLTLRICMKCTKGHIAFPNIQWANIVSVKVYGMQKQAISRSATARLIRKRAMSLLLLFPMHSTRITVRFPANERTIAME